MKNLLTFSEFINESKLNENYTVQDYLKDSRGDREWTKAAQNIVKLLKLEPNAIYWITSDDGDDKWDEMDDFWSEKAKYEDYTKKITGDDEGPDPGSNFYFDPKIPMVKYQTSGLDCYMIPASVYNSL